MIDIWAGGSLTFIFKEIFKDTLDQFRNQWLRRSALKKKTFAV